MEIPKELTPPPKPPKGTGRHGYRLQALKCYERWCETHKLLEQALTEKDAVVRAETAASDRADMSRLYSRTPRQAVYRDFRVGLAQMFNVSPVVWPAGITEWVREAVEATYPHLRKSVLRSFLEGEYTNGALPARGTLRTDDARVQVVLYVADLLETVAFLQAGKQSAVAPVEVTTPAAAEVQEPVETETSGEPESDESGDGDSAAEGAPDLPLPEDLPEVMVPTRSRPGVQRLVADAGFTCEHCGYEVEHYGPPLTVCPSCQTPVPQDAAPAEPEGCAEEPPDTPDGLEPEPVAAGAMSDVPIATD